MFSYSIIWYCHTGVLCTSMIYHQQLNSLWSLFIKWIKAADFALTAAMSVESMDAWFGGAPGMTWGMKVFIFDTFTLTTWRSSFTSPNAHPIVFKILIPIDRNCYYWLKNILWSRLWAQHFGGCAHRKCFFAVHNIREPISVYCKYWFGFCSKYFLWEFTLNLQISTYLFTKCTCIMYKFYRHICRNTLDILIGATIFKIFRAF